MEQSDKKINEMDSEIKRLQREKLFLEMLNISRENALILHKKFCVCGNTADCAWFHEIKDGIHNWEGLVHRDWFSKAERLIHANYHVSDIVKIKDIMGSL